MGGQPVVYVDEQGQPVPVEGQPVVYVDEQGQPIEALEPELYAPPAPQRINVSPEIFAKLAAGGVLTPEEMAQLSGESQVAEPAPETPPAGGEVVTAAADDSEAKTSRKKSSKKSLKASKKKKSKGCC